MSNKPLLELSRVTKSFGAVRALDNVSFSLQPGEVHALLGENGAGKSTLIKIMTGAYQPDEGSIEIAGQPVTRLTPRASHKLGVTCIYQQPALFPDLSVAENIAFGVERPSAGRRVRWKAQRRAAEKLLQSVGAVLDPETEVRELSMPEQQLVEIARALGAGARIMIMDEPTASLTQQEVELLMGVVRELRQRNVGVIYISHRLEEIFAIADRVTVLRDGESVGTHRVTDMTETTLIRLMVGREVSTIYPPPESAPGDVVLSIKHLGCKSSGIREVNLEVRAGEIVGLAGLVGAGRTELARILFGITAADSGVILLRGQPVEISSPRVAVHHGIGYVPEDRRRHGVFLDMPISSNMTMALHPTLFRGGWLRFRAERELALAFMRNLAVKADGPEAPASSLSGGNQQKVALARWLATKPQLLILDEPTQGVDVGAKAEIHRIIRQLAKEGLAVLLISSDLPEVLGMSDRIAVMRGGTLICMLDGKPDAHEVMAAALGQTPNEIS